MVVVHCTCVCVCVCVCVYMLLYLIYNGHRSIVLNEYCVCVCVCVSSHLCICCFHSISVMSGCFRVDPELPVLGVVVPVERVCRS
jgi:hypothetical protein